MQITPLDILIIAIVVFGLYRLIMTRRGSGDREDEDRPSGPVRRTKTKASELRPPPIARQPRPAAPGAGDADNGAAPPEPPDARQENAGQEPAEARREASDAYRRAEAAWEHFKSRPSSDTRGQGSVAANVDQPQDFDPEEFLAGAKAIYARMAEAWADRDLEDIRQFTTDKAYLDFKRRAEAETRSAKRQVMLVNAQLVELQELGGGQRATVFYDAMLGAAEGSRQAQEVWSFTRGGGEGDHWLLDETRPVDDTFEFQQ